MVFILLICCFLPSHSSFINSLPKSSTRHKRQNARFYCGWIDLTEERSNCKDKQEVSEAAQTAAHLCLPASPSALSRVIIVFMVNLLHWIYSLTLQLWLGFHCLTPPTMKNGNWRGLSALTENTLKGFFSFRASVSSRFFLLDWRQRLLCFHTDTIFSFQRYQRHFEFWYI